MTIRFSPAGELVTETRAGSIDTRKTGRWRLLSGDSTSPTSEIECTLGQQTTRHQIEWLADDSLRMTPPNMAGLTIKLVFRREQ